jgi:hypothetical protein
MCGAQHDGSRSGDGELRGQYLSLLLRAVERRSSERLNPSGVDVGSPTPGQSRTGLYDDHFDDKVDSP